jgi:RNA polymerase sigma-70 factor (ECF subfamily)
MDPTTKVNTCTDEELLILLNSDEAKGLESIYNRYWEPLLRYAFSFTRNEEEAKDILQDIFVRLVVKEHLKGVHSQLKAYLYKIVRSDCIRFLKNRISSIELNESFNDFLASTQADHSSQALLAKELTLQYENELINLPPRVKEVFVLSREHGLSSKQISSKLGVSDQTVRNQISHAIQVLKRKIELFFF